MRVGISLRRSAALLGTGLAVSMAAGLLQQAHASSSEPESKIGNDIERLMQRASAPMSTAKAKPTTTAMRSVQELRTFRQYWRELAYRDEKRMLTELRSRLAAARQQGDRHHEWLLLAWLAQMTSVFDVPAARPLFDAAEAAVQDALVAGDKIAAFELASVVEGMGIQQFARPPRPQRMALLQQLATEIGGPFHQGILWKMGGIIAVQAGQDGEAHYRFQRALELVSDPIERAEVLVYLAISLYDNPTRPAVNLAVAYLDEVVRTLPPERYPGLLAPVIRLSQLLARLGRPVEAVLLAQRAVNAAQAANMESALARAYVARGQAYLAAGELRAALADLEAMSLNALPVTYQLQALAGRALVRARLGEPGARDAIHQGQAVALANAGLGKAALAQFHEASASTWQLLGEPTLALQGLSQAAAIRRLLASTAQEQLVHARADTAAQEAQAEEDINRRHLLSLSAALLLAVLLSVAALHDRQRRQLRISTAQAGELAHLHEQLSALNAARSAQLAAACRALRPPAHTLNLLTEADPATLRDPEPRRRHLESARHCGRTLIDTLEALQDMTRLQDRTYLPHLERFDLAELLGEISQQYQPQAAIKGLRWHVQAGASGVFSDRHLLRRILVNLVAHVVGHAARGSIAIQVLPAEQVQCIEIICSDERIPPVAGAEAAAAAADELGLGTATAAEACDLLGHNLLVRRSPSLGVLLRVSVPRAFVPAPVDATAQTPELNRSIAIVEDDAFSRITLMNALIDAGLDAQAFGSLDEMAGPTSRFNEVAPGVLITDLHLGDHGDVTDALRELRKRPAWRDVPVLLLTGDTRDEVGALAAELGVALAYKPISVRRLLERVALLRGPQPLPQPQGPRAAVAA